MKDILNIKSYILYSRNFREGQFLVELLVALSVLMIGFLGVLTLLSRSLSLNREVSDSYVATYLANEGIEVVRNIVDANAIQQKPWNSGLADGSYEVEYNSLSLALNQDRFLYFNLSDDSYSYSGSQPTRFKRLIKIALLGSDEVEVNSIVSWATAGGANFQINVEDHFMNWRS